MVVNYSHYVMLTQSLLMHHSHGVAHLLIHWTMCRGEEDDSPDEIAAYGHDANYLTFEEWDNKVQVFSPDIIVE